MRLVIDRFEGNYAVVVDDLENTYNIDKRLLENYKESDIIYITKSEEETELKTEKLDNLVNKLFED